MKHMVSLGTARTICPRQRGAMEQLKSNLEKDEIMY